ncbi:MerR family DNA-binding protein [Leptospira wolffii]|uniref:MerR family DNA-binding protein n=1 Tax=Leptospira wolffii TaxID=409998 RepID=UPI0018DBAF6C|nr:MerR family DNA-binding protein [Leptospira wolffii]
MAEVNIETIRFYERKELIKPLERLESGYRIFSEDTVKRLRFIKSAKQLGFTLKEISELLNLQVSNKNTCNAVNKKAKIKIDEIQNKITMLKKMKKILYDLSLSCSEKKLTVDCPILAALND